MFETTRANGVLRILRISTLIIIGCPTMNNGSYVDAKCVIKRQNFFLSALHLILHTYALNVLYIYNFFYISFYVSIKYIFVIVG